MAIANQQEWRESRDRVRRAWVLVALAVCALLGVGAAAAYWQQAPWGGPLVLGTATGTLLTIALMGTWRVRCAIRRAA